MFTNFYTTLNGQRHIARSLEDGKKLVLTKSAFGKGVLPSGKYPVSAEELVAKLGEMSFRVKKASGNEYEITTNFSNYINKKILEAFHLTEMGIYGKIQNSDGSTDVDYPEKLIFYGCCSEAEADYIPATLTEFIINWSVAVAGEATIETVMDKSLVYASQKEMEALDRATFDGYHKFIGTQYSGPAGDYGIDVGKIEGRSVQNEEPTPDNPAAINSFGGEKLIFRSHGFQLYDASKNGTISEGGVTITNNGDGSFTVSGSGALTSGINRYFELTHEETVNLIKSGNLTLNAHGRVYPYFYVQLRYDSGNSNISIQGTDNDKSSKVSQDILNDPTSVLRVGFYGASGQAIVAGTVKPMLYQDGDGTWEPFKEPQSTIVAMPKRLRSLPNGVRDTYEDGVVTRRVGMLYLKGDDTETWNKSTSYDDTYYVRKPSDMKQGSVVMCDRYKYVSIDADRTQDKVVFTGGYINFKDSGFASAGEFKTWVASNPITVLYELEVPVLETLEIPTLPSWAPNTAVHCNTLGTSIEWRIKNQMVPLDPYPIGHVLITSTNENPADKFGGKWELIDKQLAYKGINESTSSISGGIIEPPIFNEIDTEGSLMGGEDGANIENYVLYGTVEGHSFTFRLELKISDNTLNTGGLLGKLNFNRLGFSALHHTAKPIIAYSEGVNAIFVCELSYNTGNIRLLKTIPLGESNTIPQGSTIVIRTTVQISSVNMLNDYCYKFYWKRIS